ncbi:MAG: oligosaccharide flippase family protein [Armatimonadetes bacterium]|nr:oligosaccharide flippase family protein [Armatimonadota bacterium]
MTTTITDPKTAQSEDSVARGAIALIGVQVVFLVGAYAVHFYLGRKLGPADYGIFGVVMAFLLWMEVSLTGGFPYAIRKFGAEQKDLLPAIAVAAMKGQAVYSMALFLIALVGAPWVARLLHDDRLTALIRLAAIDIPVYAFYFCYTGVLNGRGSYSRQAAAMISYALAKVAAILLLVALGFGIKGAIVGNVLASVGGLIAAAVLTGKLRGVRNYPVKKLLRYSAGTAVVAISFTLLINIDLFVVKAVGSAPDQVGYYTAASMLARAPFYVFIGLATAMLPALSRAAGGRDPELVTTYARQALRLQLIIIAPVTAVLSGTAPGTVDLLYSPQYAEAAPVLAVLAVGLMLLGFIHALQNILIALGDTRTPLVGTSILVVAAAAICLLLAPRLGTVGAAIGLTTVAAVGLVVTVGICAGRLGRFIAPMIVLKVIGAVLPVYAVARLLPDGGPALMIVYAVLFVLYFALLALFREITKEDISTIASAVGLRKGKKN